MGPYQRTPKEVARAIRFSGLGVRSVGPVGDFLDITGNLSTLPTHLTSSAARNFEDIHPRISRRRWDQNHQLPMTDPWDWYIHLHLVDFCGKWCKYVTYMIIHGYYGL